VHLPSLSSTAAAAAAAADSNHSFPERTIRILSLRKTAYVDVLRTRDALECKARS